MLLPLPWVCQITPPLTLSDPFLGGFYPKILMGPRYLLLAGIVNDEVADQIQQSLFAAHLSQGLVEQGSGLHCAAAILIFPLNEELLGSAGGAVTKPLGIAARKNELHRTKKALVEDLFLIGDQLANAIGHFHRAAFEFNHADGDTVDVQNKIGPSFIAAL